MNFSGDFDKEPLVYHGKEYDEAGVEALAQDILARLRGCPSLSGKREASPSRTVRLPREDRARLEPSRPARGDGSRRSSAGRSTSTSPATPADEGRSRTLVPVWR